MAGPIRIAVLADGSRARREFSQTARSGSRLGDVLKRAGRTAAIGLGVGLTAAAATAGKLAQAAASDEQSAALLARTLKNTTGATSAQVAATEKWITAQGKLFGVTDDELRPAISKLATATGDVQKAQRLASLAMDVSAGTGKSLESVSTALMKAQNGQVSALSRLGIKTKDAAGETLSLRQVTRQMADTFGGQAATKANTLQGRVDRLKVMFTEAGEALGARLLPPLSDLAFKAADAFDEVQAFSRSNISPKLEELAGWFRENKDELKDLAITTRDTALPVIKDLLSVVTGGVKVIANLPGPVKEFGVQAAIAALVLPRLSAGLTLVGTTARTASTQLASATTRTALLSRVSRQAAGLGGILLLSQAAGQASGSMRTLGGAAGGALLGFQVGGGVGAIIGGTVGALAGLATQTHAAAVEMVEARDATGSYIDTLNALTGATTAATRARVFDRLQSDKATAAAIATATRYGVASRDIVGAALGQRGAVERLAAAQARLATTMGNLGPYDKRRQALGEVYNALEELRTATGQQARDLAGEVAAGRQRAQAAQSWGDALKGVPKDVQVVLRNRGYDLSLGQVNNLADRYNLLPKERNTILRALGLNQAKSASDRALQAYEKLPRVLQSEIRTIGGGETKTRLRELNRQYQLSPKRLRLLIQATGAKATVREVTGVRNSLRDAGKTKPNLAPWLRGLESAISDGKRRASRNTQDLSTLLGSDLRKVKANLSPWRASIRTAATAAVGEGRTGATAVGAAMKAGVLAGFAGTQSLLEAEARAAVRGAIAAGRAAGDIQSPSRETAYIGNMLGQGLVDGLAARQGATKKGGRDLVRSLLAGVGEGSQGVGKAVDKISRLVEKRIKGKDEGKREKLVLRGLKDEFKALRRNGAEQDKNNRKIDTAVQRVRSLTSAAKQYAATIRQSVVDYGNVVGLGVRDGSSVVSLTALLSQLKARAAASDRFAALIAKLRGSGVNQTTIQQLLDAGPDAGLATAEAIASGGKAAVAEVNRLTAQIASTGTRLGAAMSKAYKAAGIQAAQGLVDGLKKRQRELDQVAQRIATTLVKAVKKALGIKSPSRVFRSIGDQTLRGLELGLDETYVKRLGSTRAAALQKGFGTPALDAYAAGGGAAGTPTTVTLRLSADEANRLVRGKEIVADIDYYLGNGGTTRTIVKRAGIG